jgi:hypothetical protein
MSQTIYFRGTRQEVRQILAAAVGIAAGHTPDSTGTVQDMQLRMGMEALSIVRDAYVVKAQGGTDEAGLSWPPLKPETIAYGRTHPGLNAKRANGPHPQRPLLTKDQDKLWRKLFARTTHWLVGKGTDQDEAKRIAAANAWIIVKAQGGKTILGEYGNEKVEILRDKGILLNSLSPGVAAGSAPGQVFKFGAGEVIVGTNVPYAAAHHHGVPGKLPQRRLWAEPAAWPFAWMERIAVAGRDGVVDLIKRLLAA